MELWTSSWTKAPTCIVFRSFIHSFIHSFGIFLLRLFKSTTAQRRSHCSIDTCVGVNKPPCYRQLRVKDLLRSLRDARVGFESATFRTQSTEPTTEPPHSMRIKCI